jgi:ankyrin repeat protein/CHAT domain-containing protein
MNSRYLNKVSLLLIVSIIILIITLVTAFASDIDSQLIEVAITGDTETIKFLIDNGADVNAKDKNGYTALMVAVKHDHIELVKLLIDKGVDVNVKHKGNKTALMSAAKRGNTETVKLLIDKDADVNAKDKKGKTALMIAARLGNTKTVKLLIDKGADVNAKDSSDYTTLMRAVRLGNTEIVKLLIENGADVNAKNKADRTALMSSVVFKKAETTALLLEYGADINDMDKFGFTTLMKAVLSGNTETVKQLIENGADVNAKDKNGKTALMIAVIFWRANITTNIVQLLLRNGADVNAKDKNGVTALMFAAEQGFFMTARLLIENGADINAKDKNGWSVSKWAQRAYDYDDILRLLARIENKTALRKGEFDYTALINAYKDNNNDYFRILIDNVNIKYNNGETQLMLAAKAKNNTGLSQLIKSGADINAKDNDGNTALTWAVLYDDLNAVKLLLENGADVNVKSNDGLTILGEAASTNNVDLVKLLIENGADVNIRGMDGATPLLSAVGSMKDETRKSHGVFKLLIENGADIHAKNDDGNDALTEAVKQGDFDAAKIFLDHEADINARDRLGRTILMAASLDIKAVEFLIDNGADVNAKDNYGWTVFDWNIYMTKLIGYYKSNAFYRKNYSDEFQIAAKKQKDLNKTSAFKKEINNLIVEGENYDSTGRYDKAYKIYLDLEGVCRKAGDHAGLATALIKIGGIHASWGQYEEAKKYYDRSLDIIKRNVIFPVLPTLLTNIGDLHISMKMPDKALEYYKDASYLTEIARIYSSGRKQGASRGRASLNLGQYFYNISQYEEALNYFYSSKKRYYAGGDQNNSAFVLSKIAEVYYSQGYYDKANRAYNVTLEVVKELDNKPEIARIHKSIGIMHYKEKEYVKAVNSLSESIDIIEVIRKTAEGDVRRDYLEKMLDAYQWLALAHIKNTNEVEAFKVIELSRAKLLSERLAGSDDAVHVKSVKEIQKYIPNDQAVIAYANMEWTEPFSFILDKRKMNSEFLDKPGFMSGAIDKYGEAIKNLNEAWRGINLVRKKDITNEKERKESFEDIVNYYRSLIANPAPENEKNAKMLGRMLYDYLINPVKEKIAGKKRLVIIPDGVLGFLPFETLIDEDGKYLSEKYTITYAQSMGILDLLKGREYSDSRKPIIAFGGAVYDELSYDVDMIENDVQLAYLEKRIYSAFETRGLVRDAYASLGLSKWENLPGTLVEVKAIDKNIINADLLTGEDVSEEKVKSMSSTGELFEYKVIHFATHGLVVPAMPALSALVLSQLQNDNINEDGYLTMGEIAELDLKADFVNLSACETGLGKIYGGEGVVGLTQSFLIAGANSLSVSLWKVSDKSTVDFMVSMYELVDKEGLSYADAISKIKRKFINGDFGDSYRSPYYWAPFIYYGR